MRPRGLRMCAAASAVACLLAGAAPAPAARPAATPPTWSARMQRLADALSVLVPDVVSQTRFDDPRRAARIEEAARTLAEQAHAIATDDVSPNDGAQNDEAPLPTRNPAVRLVSALFADEARRALRDLEKGDRRLARARLSTLSSYCASCHAVADYAPPSPSLALTPDDTGMSTFERAEMLRATGRPSAAIDAYMRVLDDGSLLVSRPLQWSAAATRALATAVEAGREGDALRVVDRVIATPRAPAFLRADAARWRSDLSATTDRRTPAQLVDEAARRAPAPSERSADVLWLRAKRALSTPRAGPPGPEVLALLGVVEERLASTMPSSLHELAYEACLRRAGATEAGRGCYERLERSIYVAAGLDGDISLAREDIDRLRALRSLVDSPKAGE